jgi:hypothetical protein
MRPLFFVVIAIVAVALRVLLPESPPNPTYTSTDLLTSPLSYNVTCSESYQPRVPGCHPIHCSRRVVDDFIPSTDVDAILSIARRGMDGSVAESGGPVIFDLNSGGRGLLRSRRHKRCLIIMYRVQIRR